MPRLRQVLSEEDRLKLEALRYMSEDPTTVEDMTRTQLFLHMDIRERILREAHGDGWQAQFDLEFAEKRARWEAARDLHEVEKELRGTRGR